MGADKDSCCSGSENKEDKAKEAEIKPAAKPEIEEKPKECEDKDKDKAKEAEMEKAT